MNLRLLVSAITKMMVGFLLVGLLVFLSAGTFAYPSGWILLGILFIPMFLAGILLMITSPERLEKRLHTKEESREQRFVILGSALMFVAGFILAGLGIRFGWYQLPFSVSVIFAVVFLIAYLLYAVVICQNPYLSRTIEVSERQRVVDTGLYAVVRHPMYSVTLLLFLSMPLVLGSLYAFFVFLVYPALIVKRIRHEEDFLKKELPGYPDYCKKVKYRLIPFVW
ncbi:MAG: isoprenylcysteine carboxylmethyltransferase family protein [Ruminococcaceae bacterium]|nr:isoprenylcysteine carboxylmethyltransferase family protein [Oscillospiraceae bacterium]